MHGQKKRSVHSRLTRSGVNVGRDVTAACKRAHMGSTAGKTEEAGYVGTSHEHKRVGLNRVRTPGWWCRRQRESHIAHGGVMCWGGPAPWWTDIASLALRSANIQGATLWKYRSEGGAGGDGVTGGVSPVAWRGDGRVSEPEAAQWCRKVRSKIGDGEVNCELRSGLIGKLFEEGPTWM
ncbi:hypothetical protein C8R45DRAFT_938728 [Mycena sanguinolenta]|nr:hypothetical protein C8R45DRAFT_938728 [Mycena sanguinolenta]